VPWHRAAVPGGRQLLPGGAAAGNAAPALNIRCRPLHAGPDICTLGFP
jgi:hypothetical protein